MGARSFAGAGLTWDELARLLFLTNGVTNHTGRSGLRAAPSAGALYAGEVYAVVERASVDGLTAPLIEKADRYYRRAKWIVDMLVSLRVFPSHFRVLLARFTKDAEAFIEADRLGICTTSHYTVAHKPSS